MMVTQGVYRHYKGGLYRLLFVAKDSTNNSPTADEDVAVYVSLNDSGRVSVRLLREFDELVSVPCDPPATSKHVQRFQWVGP
jgi:hypothetical protein